MVLRVGDTTRAQVHDRAERPLARGGGGGGARRPRGVPGLSERGVCVGGARGDGADGGEPRRGQGWRRRGSRALRRQQEMEAAARGIVLGGGGVRRCGDGGRV